MADSKQKISLGFIGLGTMGQPIAARLQEAGYGLVLYARRPKIFEGELKPLIDKGAKIAKTPAELARQADVILVNVMAGADVKDVLIARDDAVIHGLAGHRIIIIDHSTTDPTTAQELHEQFKSVGAGFVDSPVSGGSIGAEAGTLVAMMGGDSQDIATIIPILKHYTSRQIHVGEAGHGQIAKLCNQIAQVITIQGVAEALNFAEAHGADPQTVFDVMSSGFASSRMLDLLAPKMIADDDTPLMKSVLLDKDIGIAFDASHEAGLFSPALKIVRDQLSYVQQEQWQDKDVSVLFRALKVKK